MALHLVIKKVFRHAASHILAGQHLVTATDHKETSAQVLVRVKENLTPADHHPAKAKKDLKETSAQALVPAKENLTLADHHPAKAKKDLKEASGQVLAQAKRNHILLHVHVHQMQILAISLKEASAQIKAASVNLVQEQKDQQIKNLATGQPMADLKNAKAVSQKTNQLTMPTSRNASRYTIR